MLRAMRDGANAGILKLVLMGLLLFAVGGLVLSDVGGFFRGGISTNLVAKGHGIKISTVEFDRMVRRILARQGMSAEEAFNMGIIYQILNGEIQNRIITREAQKLGINVSDDIVTGQIAKLAEPFAAEGASKKDALQQILRSQGISEAEFVQSVRAEMGNTLFREALLSGAGAISNEQATALYRYRNESRAMEGIILTNTSAPLVEKATEENLRKFYEANKSDYTVPETRSITLATLKSEMLKDKVTVSDEELKARYEDHLDTYRQPEKRKLQQAVLSSQAEAQEVFKKLENGKTLKDAVNEVTGKTSGYLGENEFRKDGMIQEIAEEVFKADKNAKIGPLQSAMGWHVIIVNDIVAAQTEPFEKVKNALREEYVQESLLDSLADAANMLDDRLASGEKLEDVVSEMGLTTEKIENFNQAGLTQSGNDLFNSFQGDKAQILEAAFEYEAGESSPVMELADGRYVVARIDAVTPLQFTSFESLKGDLEKRWNGEQKRLSNQARAEEAYKMVQEGKSLEEIASKFGAGVNKFSALKRYEEPQKPLNLPTVRQVFEAQTGTPLKLDTGDGFVIGKVIAVNLPTDEEAQKHIKEVKDEASQVMPQEILTQYINTMSMKYDVKINSRVLESIYGMAPAGK